MRTNTPGFTVPEERFAPLPFYHRNQSPIQFRWDQFNWNKYDSIQRWFYQNFLGRTHGTIWAGEQLLQVDGTATAISVNGDYSDPRAWTLPNIVLTGNTVQVAPFNNYIDMANNARPANPYTGRAADAASMELYIAPRVTGDRMAMRFDAMLPDYTGFAQHDTNYLIGWEINSEGGQQIAALMLSDSAAGNFCRIQYYGDAFNNQAGGAYTARSGNIALSGPALWRTYYMELDPPVLRFWHRNAANTAWNAPVEISCPSLPSNAVMQPFVCNESNFLTTAAAYRFRLGQWDNWQLHRQSNTYDVFTRDCASSACGCGIYSRAFDTGGRKNLHINLKTNGCGCTYYIEHAETGLSQVAANPEVQTWRRIDDADWTGVTDTPAGEAGIGLFNASRFIRVRFAGIQATNNAGSETIAFTANDGE